MADKNKHNEEIETLLRYLNDQLSNKERYDFERELERDPFSYEAFEGLSELEPSLIEKDLKHIDFVGSKHRSGNLLLIALSVAAGFALIILSVFWLIRPEENMQKPVAENLTNNEELLIVDTAGIPTDSVLIGSEDIILVADAEITQEAVTEKQVSPTIYNEVKTSDKKVTPKKRIKPDEKVLSTVEFEASEIIDSDKSKPVDSVTKMGMLKITDEKDTFSPDTFNVPVDEENMAFKINQETDEKAKVSKRPGVNANPEPLGGNVLFRQYLSENTHYPSDVENQKREVVRLKFKVSEMGEPFGFEILVSPGDVFSEEAVRIVKEGPKWSPGIKDGLPIVDEVTLRIVFKP